MQYNRITVRVDSLREGDFIQFMGKRLTVSRTAYHQTDRGLVFLQLVNPHLEVVEIWVRRDKTVTQLVPYASSQTFRNYESGVGVKAPYSFIDEVFDILRSANETVPEPPSVKRDLKLITDMMEGESFYSVTGEKRTLVSTPVVYPLGDPPRVDYQFTVEGSPVVQEAWCDIRMRFEVDPPKTGDLKVVKAAKDLKKDDIIKLQGVEHIITEYPRRRGVTINGKYERHVEFMHTEIERHATGGFSFFAKDAAEARVPEQAIFEMVSSK